MKDTSLFSLPFIKAISSLLNRIPLAIKIGALILIFIVLIVIDYVLITQTSAELSAVELEMLVMNIITLAIILGIVLAILIYIDLKGFMNSVNESMYNYLEEKQLDIHLDEFYTGKTFYSIANNMSELLSLFKSFDAMKSNRIFLEGNTINVVLNNIIEGIVVVNDEKVVTNINHRGEELLRLKPGEAIGQAFSRKITQDKLLKGLNKTLEKQEKTLNQKVTIQKGKPLSANFIPVKDSNGDVCRCVIILNEVKERNTKK